MEAVVQIRWGGSGKVLFFTPLKHPLLILTLLTFLSFAVAALLHEVWAIDVAMTS